MTPGAFVSLISEAVNRNIPQCALGVFITISPSIGGCSKYHKSLNGGPTKTLRVEIEVSWRDAMDCFEFFGPRVGTHGPAAESRHHTLEPFCFFTCTHNAAGT